MKRSLQAEFHSTKIIAAIGGKEKNIRMKKQFVLLMAFVLVCLLGATSVVVSNNRTCKLDQKETQQQPSNDVLLYGPLNYFQL
jgi:cell division protein FtsB